MIKAAIPREEIMGPGHLACQGCGATILMRHALKALGRETCITIPACCWSVIDGPFPHSAAGVPLFHTGFAAAAATASGIRAAYEVLGKDQINVVAWAGDGGTYDIGIQALSGAAERNDDILYVCYDNEAYMNTGVQRSAATPQLAWTSTTPVEHPKKTIKKDMVSIMAAHRIPYIATATVAYIEDLIEKFQKAREIKGTRFILLFSPCPAGWKSKPEDTVKLARLAVQTRIFPLLEIVDGTDWRMSVKPKKSVPVMEYLKLQGRFRHVSEEQLQQIQRNVDAEWSLLLSKVKTEEEKS
jgi:pyruvate/2-oxoacid:ferredoxin oxidoreductase beta subunit